ncbi:hypothetical protein HGM15179_016186 [Zosterops borbonicus]|uniref:Uncharacterized protein n=1 Tax=Zosterops borbonicus TaxID=364589 RepID=A0A8K1G3L2_9PASS|nr:hypothetical protein HGM15179_016186 [Zosterops borbonicus]
MSTELQLVLVQGVQEFAIPFDQVPEVPATPFLQPIEDPSNGGTTLWCGSHAGVSVLIRLLQKYRHKSFSTRFQFYLLEDEVLSEMEGFIEQ